MTARCLLVASCSPRDGCPVPAGHFHLRVSEGPDTLDACGIVWRMWGKERDVARALNCSRSASLRKSARLWPAGFMGPLHGKGWTQDKEEKKQIQII